MDNFNKRAKFLQLYSMALADGNIANEELMKFYKIGTEIYNISPEQINSYLISVGPTQPKLDTLQEQVGFLYEMTQIALADSHFDDSERVLIAKYIRQFDFEEENVDGIIDYLVEKAKDDTKEEDVIQEILNS